MINNSFNIGYLCGTKVRILILYLIDYKYINSIFK